MAERERRGTPPFGTSFVARSRVMEAADVERAIRRMAHEISEQHHGAERVYLVGLQTGGVAIARALAAELSSIEKRPIEMGTIDVAMYRDDIGLRPVLEESETDIAVDIDGRTIVLVDDVLFTGRTIRAALNELSDFGRPRCVQLCVLVDRGHRELPIQPDYAGFKVKTAREDKVRVELSETGAQGDRVIMVK